MGIKGLILVALFCLVQGQRAPYAGSRTTSDIPVADRFLDSSQTTGTSMGFDGSLKGSTGTRSSFGEDPDRAFLVQQLGDEYQVDLTKSWDKDSQPYAVLNAGALKESIGLSNSQIAPGTNYVPAGNARTPVGNTQGQQTGRNNQGNTQPGRTQQAIPRYGASQQGTQQGTLRTGGQGTLRNGGTQQGDGRNQQGNQGYVATPAQQNGKRPGGRN